MTARKNDHGGILLQNYHSGYRLQKARVGAGGGRVGVGAVLGNTFESA